MPAGNIGRAQSDIENADCRYFLLPEFLLLDQLMVHKGRIVDQHIEVPLLRFDLGKDAGDLQVIAMIAQNRDAPAASRINRSGSFGDGARQDRAIPTLGVARGDCAPSDINSIAQLTKPTSDARASSAAGSGDQGNFRFRHQLSLSIRRTLAM